MGTAKHKVQKHFLEPSNQKLSDFCYEHQKLAKNAFRIPAQAIIERFVYAKLPPPQKKSFN